MQLVDLFCGCGGFSLGARQAGFAVPLAIDIDSDLTSSRAFNFPRSRLALTDVRVLSGSDLLKGLDGRPLTGLIGGPPCQGFSTIGKRDSTDPRRELLYHFFRLVSEAKPRFFVMENVTGLAFEGARHLLDQSLELVAKDYVICGPLILDARDYGAPTKRRRLFVIGTLKSSVDAICSENLVAYRRAPVDVRSAIGDLTRSSYLRHEDGFDVWKIDGRVKRSEYAERMRSLDRTFTGNQRSVHSASVVRRFQSVLPGEVDAIGKHHRLSWSGFCPTLRAGTGMDKGSYQSVRPLHPEEPRVITVREAARLQGFPDSFRFHPSIWHSFRMIGNSVSPLQSGAIFSLLRSKMDAPN